MEVGHKQYLSLFACFTFNFFSFPFLSQPGLTNVQSKWCSADEPDHTAVLCYKAEWEISAICCQIPHAMQLAAFKAPPNSFFQTQVRLQLLLHLMYSVDFFSTSQNLLALLISVSKNTLRGKKRALSALPRRKIKLLKKKNGPTTFKECRMFRHSKLFKSHYGRKPYQQVTLVPNIKYYSSQGSDLLWPRTTSLQVAALLYSIMQSPLPSFLPINACSYRCSDQGRTDPAQLCSLISGRTAHCLKGPTCAAGSTAFCTSAPPAHSSWSGADGDLGQLQAARAFLLLLVPLPSNPHLGYSRNFARPRYTFMLSSL